MRWVPTFTFSQRIKHTVLIRVLCLFEMLLGTCLHLNVIFFNHKNSMKWMVPAGPDHAQRAAANGVIDYFDALDEHHGNKDDSERPRRVATLFKSSETPHIKAFLEYMETRNDVHLIGPSDPSLRAATISFVVPHMSASSISQKLAGKGIMTGAGHYYAVRLFDQMGLDPEAGAVRLSFVHYTSTEDMTKLIRTLDEILKRSGLSG